tara:strand:- start:1360 stop:1821 length:462 start_codon:yes stop_codon:yes gene_type:complete
MDIMIDKLAEILTVDEGKRTLCYDDATGETIKPGTTVQGNITIGIGRDIQNFGLSEDEIQMLLKNDIKRVIEEASNFSFYQELNQTRKIVILSMLFNLGLTRFNKFIKFKKAVHAQSYDVAAMEMRDSLYYRQLSHRVEKLAVWMDSGNMVSE